VIHKGEGTERDRRLWRKDLKETLVATCTICGLRWAAEAHNEVCPVCHLREHVQKCRYAIGLLRDECSCGGVVRADERFKLWQIARADPLSVKMYLP